MYTCTYVCLYIGKWDRELLTKANLKVKIMICPEGSLSYLWIGSGVHAGKAERIMTSSPMKYPNISWAGNGKASDGVYWSVITHTP